MSILVTGGTGFIGRLLVEKLLKKEKVIVFARKEDEELDKKCNLVLGDVTKTDELKEVFSEHKINIIYHLAANIDEDDKNMYNDNITGTKNVIDFAKQNAVKRIIFMSSSGVLGETKEPATEDFPYNPKTSYEKSKAQCEKMLIESGLPYTIIRASIIIGTNNIWLNIIKAAKKGYPIIGSGKNYFHLAHVKDVVSLLFLVMDNKKAENQIFHIATKDAPIYEEVYRIICDELGISMTKKHVSVRVVYIMSWFHSFTSKLRRKKPKLIMMRSSIDRLIRNRIISIDKAKHVLNFEPEYDTRKAIKETIQYFKERGNI